MKYKQFFKWWTTDTSDLKWDDWEPDNLTSVELRILEYTGVSIEYIIRNDVHFTMECDGKKNMVFFKFMSNKGSEVDEYLGKKLHGAMVKMKIKDGFNQGRKFYMTPKEFYKAFDLESIR